MQLFFYILGINIINHPTHYKQFSRFTQLHKTLTSVAARHPAYLLWVGNLATDQVGEDTNLRIEDDKMGWGPYRN